MNFLVTSVGTATGVGIIKNIRKYEKDARIIGTDINPVGYTAGSGLVDAFYRVPLGTDPEYEAVIRGIITGEAIDVFWPVNDTEIRRVADWDLEESCRCVVADPAIIDLVQDKKAATQKAASFGLTVPGEVHTGYPGSTIIRDRTGVGSKGIRFLPDIREEKIPTDAFAQQRIEGQEYTVDTLCDLDGKPLYIIPRSRLEVKAGIATKTRVEKKDELIDAVKTVVTHLKLPGFSNTQFIVDKKGDAYFVETNPRIGGFSSASLLAAPDMFPTYLKLLKRESVSKACNKDVRWNLVVTRYYEEICYEDV